MENYVVVEGPDGQSYEFPAGTTEEVALAFFRRTMPKPLTTGERVMKGVLDPFEGGAQMLEQGVKAVAPGAVDAVNAVNNWLAQFGIVAPVGKQGVSGDVAAREAAYRERLKSTLDGDKIDWARIGGNVTSPVNVALGAAAPATLPARLALAGAENMLFTPTQETDKFGEEKAKQFALGVAGAGVLEPVARVAGRMISPNAATDPKIQALRREGITPTVGQLLGPKASRVEQGLTSTALLGGMIGEARHRTTEDFNRAIANRTLRVVGEKAPADVPVGHELFDYVDETLKSKFSDLLPNLGGSLDPKLTADINNIRQMGQNLPDPQMNQLNRIIQNEIIDRFTSSGKASGETVKLIESKLGGIAKDYMRTGDPDQRMLGNAVRELQANLRQMLERQNPQYAGDLQNLNRAWANMMRMEKAAVASGRTQGVFSSEQYMSAVKASEQGLRKRKFAKGKALDQGFADIATQVLGRTVPDSGTASRSAMALGLAGSYFIHPALLASELLAMAPYTKAGQSAADKLIAGGGAWRQPIDGALKSATPFLYPGTGAVMNEQRPEKELLKGTLEQVTGSR